MLAFAISQLSHFAYHSTQSDSETYYMHTSEQHGAEYAISNRELMAILLRSIRPYRGRFFASTFFRLLGELTFTANPYLYATMITLITERAPLSVIYLYFGLWGASYIVRIGGQRLGRWIGNRMNERIAIDAEIAGLDQLIRWPLLAHEAEDSGNKIKRVYKGAEGIKQILKLWQDQWIGIFSHIITMLIVVSFTSFWIGLLLVAFLITYYAIARPLLKRASDLARRVNKQEEEVGGFIFEIVNTVRTIKVMHLYPWLRERLSALANELYRRIERRSAAYQGSGMITGTYAQIVRLALVSYIIYGVMQGTFSIGFLLLFIMYFTNLRDSTEQLSESVEEFAIARHHIARFVDVTRVAEGNPEAGTKPFPADWKRITIKNLSFAYGTNQVLSNLSLTINRGERVGIVGLSGAGKSTLFKLLLKEHRHFTGDILFDDISIRDIDPKSFAAHTAVVLQDTEVFNLSLKENIILGVPGEAQEAGRLEKALTVSHVREFLPKLPVGIDTTIGEKGVKLSGGERQRVGIARAVFKEPQILFLDEATSHLDVESEEKIQDSLHQFFQEVTAIVIAHRLTTIKEMDRILVIDDGRILEEGSFDQLYAGRGKFYDLWEKQKL